MECTLSQINCHSLIKLQSKEYQFSMVTAERGSQVSTRKLARSAGELLGDQDSTNLARLNYGESR